MKDYFYANGKKIGEITNWGKEQWIQSGGGMNLGKSVGPTRERVRGRLIIVAGRTIFDSKYKYEVETIKEGEIEGQRIEIKVIETKEPIEIGNTKKSLFADIESLRQLAGHHRKILGFHRLLSNRFPFAIYYSFAADEICVRAVLDCRRDPRVIRRRLKSSDY